jgi:hypothetical protein
VIVYAHGSMRRPGLAVALLLSIALVVPLAARANRDGAVLEPLLEVQVLDRELLAIDAESGGERSERLERGEQVLYTRSEGRVGVVVTNRRVLAIATRSGAWQEARLRDHESPPADVILGDRVALAVLATRAVGFDGGSGNLIESTLGPREVVRDSATGQNVAVVVTDRRALGLSSDRGGFFEVRLRPSERIESLDALANHATVQTSERLLVFRGETASWEERRRPIR